MVEDHLLDRRKVRMIADQSQMIGLHTEAEAPTINHPPDLTGLHVNMKENPNRVKEPNGHGRSKAEKEPDQEEQIPIVFQTADCLPPKWMALELFG
jgi:hypothetical protein